MKVVGFLMASGLARSSVSVVSEDVVVDVDAVVPSGVTVRSRVAVEKPRPRSPSRKGAVTLFSNFAA